MLVAGAWSCIAFGTVCVAFCENCWPTAEQKAWRAEQEQQQPQQQQSQTVQQGQQAPARKQPSNENTIVEIAALTEKQQPSQTQAEPHHLAQMLVEPHAATGPTAVVIHA